MAQDPTVQGSTAIAGLIRAGYEVLGTLGEGGFGVVYQARQQSTGQLVAVKLMSERLLSTAAGDQAAARFEREMRLVAELRHPNLVRLIDSGQLESGALFAVMEYIEGEELAAVIERDEQIRLTEAVRLMSQVLDALCTAHSKGVVHRDLKPANIMLTSTGGRRNAMVLDFGIAGMLEDVQPTDFRKLTTKGQFFGTPAYMAPEQFSDEPLSPASDIYAWGLIFLECLTGSHAIDGDSLMKMIATHMSPDPIHLPEPIARHPVGTVLRRALEKRAEARYPNAQEALAALERMPPTQLDLSAVKAARVAHGLLSETMDSVDVPMDTSQELKKDSEQARAEAARAAADRVSAKADSAQSVGQAPGAAGPETAALVAAQKRDTRSLQLMIVAVLGAIVLAIVLFTMLGGKDDPKQETPADAENGDRVGAVPGDNPTAHIADADAHISSDSQDTAPEQPDQPVPTRRVESAEVTLGLSKAQLRQDWEVHPKFDVDHDIGLSSRPSESFTRPALDVMTREVTWADWETNPVDTGSLCADGEAERGEAELDDPVVNVAPLEAERFCQALGMRLPNAREFEAIARGAENRRYPFGDDLDDGKKGHLAAERRSEKLSWNVTPEGVMGLAGGVAEWVRCTGLAYCSEGFGHRGGSFARDPFWMTTWVQGFPPDTPSLSCHRAADIGFRCVKDAR